MTVDIRPAVAACLLLLPSGLPCGAPAQDGGEAAGEAPEVGEVESLDDVKLLAQSAALPSLKGVDKFILRESWWNGRLDPGEAKLIQVQLFRRNVYRFWLAVPDRDAELNLNLYDSEGELVPSRTLDLEESNLAATEIEPAKTGLYYVRISLKTSIDRPQDWAVIYAYR